MIHTCTALGGYLRGMCLPLRKGCYKKDVKTQLPKLTVFSSQHPVQVIRSTVPENATHRVYLYFRNILALKKLHMEKCQQDSSRSI